MTTFSPVSIHVTSPGKCYTPPPIMHSYHHYVKVKGNTSTQSPQAASPTNSFASKPQHYSVQTASEVELSIRYRNDIILQQTTIKISSRNVYKITSYSYILRRVLHLPEYIPVYWWDKDFFNLKNLYAKIKLR